MGELEQAVAAIVNDCLAVRAGEEVLVVANPATIGLAERLRAEAGRLGAEGVTCLMAERPSHGVEPPRAIAAAMAAADVVLAPTLQSLSHTGARRRASEAGARIATLPGVTEEMLARVMSGDLEALRRRSAAVAERLTGARSARLTCARGSDLRLELGEREAIADTGILSEPGQFGNLPCGEGFIAPLEEGAHGRAVVDGTIAGIGPVTEPVELEVEAGLLASASGAEGERLLELLRPHGEAGLNLAELGIGTNERARLSGNVLEDEKILGSAHIAFGASDAIGGTVRAPIHLDCVITAPTIELDGEVVVRDGELLIGG